ETLSDSAGTLPSSDSVGRGGVAVWGASRFGFPQPLDAPALTHPRSWAEALIERTGRWSAAALARLSPRQWAPASPPLVVLSSVTSATDPSGRSIGSPGPTRPTSSDAQRSGGA